MTLLLCCLLSFDPFYFIHYADPQIGRNASAEPNLALAVSQINAIQPRAHFVVVAGDMANNPENQSAVLNQWRICDSLYDLLTMPVHVSPGNNDVGYEDEGCWTPAQLQLYRNFWGMDYYSFDADSCHFIALNSTLLDTYSGHACYPYSLEQDSFIRVDLQNTQSQEYKHLFFFFHFPLYRNSPNDGNGRSVVDRPRRDTILQYLIDYNFTEVLTGHWHGFWMNLYGPSLLYTGQGTSNGTNLNNNSYNVVKIFHNGIETFPVRLASPIDTVELVNIVTATADPETVTVGVPVSFDCIVDSINFPGWTGLSYKWKFGDGDSSTSATINHTYADTGHYQVIFRAYRLHTLCAQYRLNIVVRDDQYVEEGERKEVANSFLRVGVLSNVIEFEIPVSGPVTLDVFQSDGRLIDQIVYSHLDKGLHRTKFEKNMPSGVYFLKLSTSETSVTQKFVYVH